MWSGLGDMSEVYIPVTLVIVAAFIPSVRNFASLAISAKGLIRRRYFYVAIGVACACMLWLDAVVGILAFGLAMEPWWVVYAIPLCLLLLLVWRVVPREQGDRRHCVAGILLLVLWTLALPSIPWHTWKAFNRDNLRIRGKPMDAVQQIMGDYYILTGLPDEDGITDGSIRQRISSFDMLQFHQGMITLGAYRIDANVSYVCIEDGIVEATWVSPD